MRLSVHRWRTCAASAAALSLLVVTGPTALAITPQKPAPAVSARVSAPSPPRIGDAITVSVTGLSFARKPATATFLSPSGEQLTRLVYPKCTAKDARRTPAKCRSTAAATLDALGVWSVTVTDGARVLATQAFTARPSDKPWSPPAGWSPSEGWAMTRQGHATYAPCANVAWFYARADEPAAAAGMRAEISASLAVLAAETGLTFTETAGPPPRVPSGEDPTLAFTWKDLSVLFPGAAATGGSGGSMDGYVSFGTGQPNMTDGYSGPTRRGRMVIHEVMHALGFDHVLDPASIMNPMASYGRTGFSAGDLDGLHTMYKNNPCP